MDPKSIKEQTIRDAKCSLILDASRKVFSDKGFHESRLEDIAVAAGFSKASLYNYFTDKEQIFLSLAIRDFDELLARLRVGISSTGTLISSIEFLYRTVLTFFGEHFSFFWALTSFETMCNIHMQRFQKHHDEMVKRFEEHYAGLLGTFVEILHNAKVRGELKSPIDEMALARFIASLVRGTVFEWKISGKIENVEQTVKNLLAFTTNGLEYQPVIEAEAVL